MATSSELTDSQLLQFSRQLMLPQIDVEGQLKLFNANILVLGAGGLGCPALAYLASCGVGNIIIVDPDIVELSNIQRQILFDVSDTGKNKAYVAEQKIQKFNPDLKLRSLTTIPEQEELMALFSQADVVLDGTDNFSSRYRHNQISVETKTPLVSGAVIRFEGQLTCFDHRNVDAPCYHCLYPDGQDEQLNCSENGVLGSVAGLVGTMMATEAIKLVLGIGESLSGKLLLLDALNMEWRTVGLSKDSSCSVCSKYK